MKKILVALFFALTLIACDTGTNTPSNVVSNQKYISGKVLERSTTGSVVGGGKVVACLESSRKCVRTNSKGEYLISDNNILARSYGNDTGTTPENLPASDNVSGNVVQDTVKISTNGSVLYEVPITSWKSVLPDLYIVQRNISGNILKNVNYTDLKNVEAIFWNNDSIAMVIPLEISTNGITYSGFVYQPYDDSSFQKSLRRNNIFARLIDKNDSVFAVTSVQTYSERAGDIQISDTLIPGYIQRYPKPNTFIALKQGESVKVLPIVTSDLVSMDSAYGDLIGRYLDSSGTVFFIEDSIPTFLRGTFKNVDSVIYVFNSSVDLDSCEVPDRYFHITKGINRIGVKFSVGNNYIFDFSVSHYKPMQNGSFDPKAISNLKTYLKFKK